MSLAASVAHPAVSFQGGTFNNIAGNLNITSIVSEAGYNAPLPPDREPSAHLEYGRDHHISGQAGPLRTKGDVPRHNYMPYNRPRPPSISHQDSNRAFIDDHPEQLLAAPTHSHSTFYTVGGNMANVNRISYGENGLDILYRSVAKDAMHDSAERPPDPACHPGTRETVLDTLRAWSRDDSPEARLMWLHGSAGMGKSAIAQAFAAERQEDGSLGASFFFRRGDRGRGNWKSLFPTLAYQLAASFPQLRDALKQAVESDKLVFGQAMRHQFAKLAIAPFERSPPLAVRPIVVMDGLDECEDHSDQVMLLNLIIGGLRAGTFPVRFLIASRPEAHLRELLQATANFDVCRHLELRSDDSADADIHRYLCDEFQRIRKCHKSRGISLDDGWPGEDAINHLVKKSSATFIYAVTVVRYVADEYSHPVERLDSVLALDPDSTAPLDNLYTQILSAVSNRSVLRRVLHAVVKVRGDWDPEEIDLALQLRPGTSRLLLRGLHSLLFVPPIRTIGLRYDVELLHASLGDFLRDSARSSDLCIAPPELDYALVRTMTKCLSSTPQDTLLFQVIVTNFLECIVRVSPAPNLLPILYDVGVQDAVCWDSQRFPPEIVEWLKNSSPSYGRSTA
ncbi:hypothetical protein C8R47DRAFT_607770 [Mycena vitilis]|nr:hypothetical protein C8R47DRAFT_607770 [Mycena vitilis]